MRYVTHFLIAIYAAFVIPNAANGQDVQGLLRAADQYRVPSDNLEVETLVESHRADGSVDKRKRYIVFVQTGRKSLVLMQSPGEKGQKVLMLGDDFWLLMPSSQRPMRITPMQKLLGEASTGDIASMSWAGDYSGRLVGEEPCASDTMPVAAGGPTVCQRLSLQAARKGVTYQHIELWLSRDHHEPVRADLYVQSDKLAKQARFVMDRASAPTQVDEMVLIDHLGNDKQTIIRYLGRKQRTVPAEWLNPMFLSQNPALD